ncbi:NYN domain-containing protein [Patescibacteria group bacterium]
MPIIKHKEQRVAVLIDVSNMYHSAKNIYNARVNFKEILKTAVAGRKLIRAVSYLIRTESGEEKAFSEALVKMGLEIKMKDLQIFYGGMKKADWDVGICIDAIKLSSIVDVIVLVSGDGDYVPMVEYLKNQGRQVEAIAFGKSASAKLRESVDDFIDLSEYPGKYLLKSKTKRTKNK